LHKHYTIEQWQEFASLFPEVLPYVLVSIGSSEAEFLKLHQITSLVPQVRMICLDVANGYAESFVSTVRRARKEFPNHTIFAGNVVTG